MNGIDVDAFVKSLAVKQFGKAAKGHRNLSELQASLEAPMDHIGTIANQVMRENAKGFAATYGIPDLQQLELISGTLMSQLLLPGSIAVRQAARLSVSSLVSLQEAFMNRRIPRSGLSAIMKSIPAPFASLVRAGSLVPTSEANVWLSEASITPIALVSSKSIRYMLTEKRYPELGVRLEKIYKRADWPPPWS